MIKIAICDDESIYREQVEMIISEYAKSHTEYDISYSVFEWGEDLFLLISRLRLKTILMIRGFIQGYLRIRK